MLFNSLEFAVFLPVVLFFFHLLRGTQRIWMLLAASSYFYAFFIPKYLIILLAVIVIDYFSGIFIETSSPRGKKFYLVLSIIANVGILFTFKYFNFFSENIGLLANSLGWNYSPILLTWALPIGLSFHVFQSMSYTIEVYFGRTPAERSFPVYSLYVLYFPQLVAGPIERPQNLLHQFKTLDAKKCDVVGGLELIGIGLFKKCVIADSLTITVDQIFNNSAQYGAISLWIGIIFFSFQIFCDFSGYSDIARGTSKLMGVELMLNFDKPYFSETVTEFWRRWHISLSTWFRDYLYIPLGGNKVVYWRKLLNIFIVFLVSGLWHGAQWTFVVWGGLHGLMLVIENTFKLVTKKSSDFNKFVRIIINFFVVSIIWVFFRATSIEQAFQVILNLNSNYWLGWNLIKKEFVLEGFLMIGFLVGFQILDNKYKNLWKPIHTLSLPLRFSIYSLMTFIFILLGQFNAAQFIYFQF